MKHSKKICKYCGCEFTNSGSFTIHMQICKQNPNKQIFTCEFCSFISKTQNGITLHQKYCKNNPNRVDAPKQSEEARKKVSEARKRTLKEHPEYQQLWRYKKSEACEKLKEKLRAAGFVFEEEYHDDSWDRLFSLDIAFVDKKLDIEVNGTMHYDENGELKDYYKERHNYLVNHGWKVIEFEHYKCFISSEVDFLIQLIYSIK